MLLTFLNGPQGWVTTVMPPYLLACRRAASPCILVLGAAPANCGCDVSLVSYHFWTYPPRLTSCVFR